MQSIPYDNRIGKIWFDGELVEWNDARIHVVNQGLHYAGCVFEGSRAYDGVIFKNLEHCERLKRSAGLLGFEIPYSVDELVSACEQSVAVNNLKDAYVRPFAWRGSQIMGISGKGNKIHVSVAAWEWPSYFSEEIKQRGLRLDVSQWKRPSPETAPCASKAAGLYMICTLAKQEADSKGFDDALMLDYRGYIAEATAANFFMIENGELHTPTPDCFLDGITRRTAMDLAKHRGIKVVERHIQPVELKNATEIFVTGTAAEVTPVGQIGELNWQVGPVTRQIMEDYQNLVRGKLA